MSSGRTFRSDSAGVLDPSLDWCGITVIASPLGLPITQTSPLQLAQSRVSVVACNSEIPTPLVNRYPIHLLPQWGVFRLWQFRFARCLCSFQMLDLLFMFLPPNVRPPARSVWAFEFYDIWSYITPCLTSTDSA